MDGTEYWILEGDGEDEDTVVIVYTNEDEDPRGTKSSCRQLEEDLPLAECMTLIIEGGEDGPNHGNVVSQSVHALKGMELAEGVPFGHYVRELAKSDFGKKHYDEDGEEEELVEVPETDIKGDDGDKDKDGNGHGKPDHAKGPKK